MEEERARDPDAIECALTDPRPLCATAAHDFLSSRLLMSRRAGAPTPENEAQRHFELEEMLFEFSRLFDYSEVSDRAVAIVGPAFLDTLLTQMLVNFLVDDDKEVLRVLQPEGPLGTFGSKVSACYCLGLIGEIVKGDLRLVAKIRNRFAHDLRATFSDAQIGGWCKALRWHKQFFPDPPAGATDRDLFQVGVNQLVSHLHGLVALARTDKRREFQPGHG
jgi:DNA-binding MltR family transcriptional regulator